MTVHPTAIIGDDVELHESVQVGPFCVIGSEHGPLRLGAGTIVRSHTIIEGGSEIGDGLETGHHALIRTGNSIGANLRLGSYASLEGGAEIGDYVRIHGRVEVPRATIRHFARIYGMTAITENRLPPSNVNVLATIEEAAVLAMSVIVLAGVRVGIGAFVAAGEIIRRDVPDGMVLVMGRLRPVTGLTWQGYSYPWTAYYRDGYPPESWPRIDALNDRILAAIR